MAEQGAIQPEFVREQPRQQEALAHALPTAGREGFAFDRVLEQPEHALGALLRVLYAPFTTGYVGGNARGGSWSRGTPGGGWEVHDVPLNTSLPRPTKHD